ncbi:MAG TPA: hypothetical protein VMT15_22365 [Bryobacteraceae bacterium]|nr:hypothetical protein [Bryobacteraceae bacterium]
MAIAASLGVFLLATLMLAGWGWAFQKILRQEGDNWPETIVLGLGALVFAGGILNLARLASPWALAILAVAGVLMGVFALRQRLPERPPLAASLMIAAIVLFTAATQLRPGVYNFHDDFQKYFAHVVRMLETGTVYGSPLSAMGSQTLGAKAFLDGFVAALFPIAYLNGVDAVFGLLLCLMLATQFGATRTTAALCALTVFAINPQYVNVSALFLGSALIMALASLDAGRPLSVGLLYAALIAMKPTFVIFVAIHMAAMALAVGLRWAWRSGWATALFLSPWMLVHSPHYVYALLHRRLSPPHVQGTIDTDQIHLFSWAPLDYGDTSMHFTLLAAAIAICGLLCWYAPAGKRMLAFCACSVPAYLVFVYVFSPLEFGYGNSVRYFCPVAIGLAPPAFGWASTFARRRWIPVALTVLIVALFLPSTITRMKWAVHNHSIAAYDWLAQSPPYIAYSRRVLSDHERQAVAAMQNFIPAGEPVLAWINDPFYLDYGRNKIVDIDPAGVGGPWAHLPPAKYLILDYNGYPTATEDDYKDDALDAGAAQRRNAEYTLDFLHRINGLVEKGEVLFDNEEVRVVRIRN